MGTGGRIALLTNDRIKTGKRKDLGSEIEWNQFGEVKKHQKARELVGTVSSL